MVLSARGIALSSALLVLGGCGGGGHPPDTIEVSFSPGTLTAHFTQGNFPAALPASATLSRLPTRAVYVVLVEDAAVLSAGDLSVSQDGNSFSTSLTPACMLSPGSHAGVLTLELCYDAGCSEPVPLSGNQLPYDFTVDAGLLVTATIDGVDRPGQGAACSWLAFDVKAGQEVQLTATIPASWDYTAGQEYSMPTVDGLTTSDTAWAATVDAYCGSLPSGTTLGTLMVTPTPLSGALPFPLNVSMTVVAP